MATVNCHDIDSFSMAVAAAEEEATSAETEATAAAAASSAAARAAAKAAREVGAAKLAGQLKAVSSTA